LQRSVKQLGGIDGMLVQMEAPSARLMRAVRRAETASFGRRVAVEVGGVVFRVGSGGGAEGAVDVDEVEDEEDDGR